MSTRQHGMTSWWNAAFMKGFERDASSIGNAKANFAKGSDGPMNSVIRSAGAALNRQVPYIFGSLLIQDLTTLECSPRAIW
eukprot:6187665-Heterocapsa_arctica.AAC.1